MCLLVTTGRAKCWHAPKRLPKAARIMNNPDGALNILSRLLMSVSLYQGPLTSVADRKRKNSLHLISTTEKRRPLNFYRSATLQKSLGLQDFSFDVAWGNSHADSMPTMVSEKLWRTIEQVMLHESARGMQSLRSAYQALADLEPRPRNVQFSAHTLPVPAPTGTVLSVVLQGSANAPQPLLTLKLLNAFDASLIGAPYDVSCGLLLKGIWTHGEASMSPAELARTLLSTVEPEVRNQALSGIQSLVQTVAKSVHKASDRFARMFTIEDVGISLPRSGNAPGSSTSHWAGKLPEGATEEQGSQTKTTFGSPQSAPGEGEQTAAQGQAEEGEQKVSISPAVLPPTSAGPSQRITVLKDVFRS